MCAKVWRGAEKPGISVGVGDGKKQRFVSVRGGKAGNKCRSQRREKAEICVGAGRKNRE